jgi:hypothetical protein
MIATLNPVSPPQRAFTFTHQWWTNGYALGAQQSHLQFLSFFSSAIQQAE